MFSYIFFKKIIENKKFFINNFKLVIAILNNNYCKPKQML